MSSEEGAKQRAATQPYRRMVMDHAVHPRNLGTIEGADGHARVTGPCHDTIEMWLTVRRDVITDISFVCDGCLTSLASGSMATELAKGRKIGEAVRITRRDILEALGGLPAESEHCALLAADTLKAAIRDFIDIRNEPWKKPYRR